MQAKAASGAKQMLLNGVSTSAISSTGQVEIGGKRFFTASRLSAMLGISERTLQRWGAARIGPPKVQVSKMILYDEEKLAGWLANNETAPVRSVARRG